MGWAGPGRLTTTCGGWPGEPDVQLGQHDDVELKPLGLVDGHHADRGASRVFDPGLADLGHEIVGPQRGGRLVAVSHLDQLHQPALVAGVAVRGELAGPAGDVGP